MFRWSPLFIILTLSSILITPFHDDIQASAYSRSAAPIDSQPVATLQPLPGTCGSGLGTRNADSSVCCMYGYVLIDGRPVSGAKVTIAGANGQIEQWTTFEAGSEAPFYRVSLSAPPLSAQPGEHITITAEYSTHTASIDYVVRSGGQQVDLVLHRSQPEDYAYRSQIWKQDQPGQLNSPVALAVDSAGNLYVLDRDNARVQVFDRDGNVLNRWGVLGGQPGQFATPAAIALDPQDYVYVADTANNRVQKFTSTGTLNAVWGDSGDSVSFNQPKGVAISADGDVYVLDSLNQRVVKLTTEGVLVGTWGSKGTAPGQLRDPKGIAVDRNGYVYVTDTLNNRVQKFSADGTFVNLWGSPGALDGQFNAPRDIAVDRDGFVYVADSSNHRIQKFSADGLFIESMGSLGSAPGQLNDPRGVAIGADGSLYIADSGNERIQRLTSGGAWQATFGGPGDADARLNRPRGVAVDRGGNIYVADTENHQIQKFSANGTLMRRWGGRGSAPGQLNWPNQLAIDVHGDVLVADSENDRIQKFSADGSLLSTWGTFGTDPGQFNYPRAIALDPDGNIYVAEADNHRVQKFSADGQFITMWGSRGTGDGQFNIPRGIAVDALGNVYVTDGDNHRIQKFSADGQFLRSWGAKGFSVGTINGPRGIKVGPDGNIYVAESGNERIQKWTPDGEWLMAIGGRGGVEGQFREPQDLAFMPDGAIVVADSYNDRLQILDAMRSTEPFATIAVATPRSVVQGQQVELFGLGADSDETPDLAAYEWLLDSATTPFATDASASLSTAQLALGPHTITLRVRDTEGQISPPQSLTIDVLAASASPTQTWTFLLYLAGDNHDIADYMSLASPIGALNRLANSDPNPNVRVVALFDGDRPGGGDTIRYVFDSDGTVASEPRGEMNMGDPRTLEEFIRWGRQTAPANHYYLAIADHANALDGIAWDYTSDQNERLTNGELRQALSSATEHGAHPIDVLHLDGCLMGLYENAYQARELADYLIVSQNLGWSAFAYESYRAAVGTDTEPRDLATAIVDRYAARVGNHPFTISALDLSRLSDTTDRIDVFAGALSGYVNSESHRAVISDIRADVQTFDSNGDLYTRPSDDYIDLKDWSMRVAAATTNAEVKSAAGALRSALDSLVVEEQHRSGSYNGVPIGLASAGGVSIYFPQQRRATSYEVYIQGELAFPRDTRWDEFLHVALAELPFDSSEPQQQPVPPLPIETLHRVFAPVVVR